MCTLAPQSLVTFNASLLFLLDSDSVLLLYRGEVIKYWATSTPAPFPCRNMDWVNFSSLRNFLNTCTIPGNSTNRIYNLRQKTLNSEFAMKHAFQTRKNKRPPPSSLPAPLPHKSLGSRDPNSCKSDKPMATSPPLARFFQMEWDGRKLSTTKPADIAVDFAHEKNCPPLFSSSFPCLPHLGEGSLPLLWWNTETQSIHV